MMAIASAASVSRLETSPGDLVIVGMWVPVQSRAECAAARADNEEKTCAWTPPGTAGAD